MKHFTKNLRWLLMSLLLVTGLGSAWGEEVVYKTALFGSDYNSQSVNSYTATWSATNDGFTVNLTNFNNNQNGWAYVKCGSKNTASVGTIITNSTLDQAITKVVVTVDAVTKSKVNSFKLYVASDANFTNDLQTITQTIATGQNTFTVTTPTANRYYKIEIDCDKGTSNGLVTISKVEYYYDNGSAPSPSISADDVSLDYDETSGEIDYEISNPVDGASISASSSDNWIGNCSVNTSTNKVTFTTSQNEGSTDRTGTITLTYSNGGNTLATKDVTVTQGHLTVDYVTLPFNWEGGASADLIAIDGVSADGLGSDYAASNSPYLVRFDSDGDFILFKTDSQPGKVTIGVKMIGGNSASTITVQESSDGETFTDVQTLTISGAQYSVLNLETTSSFASSSRYVKLVFTKGSNVGVGPISITMPTTEPSITVTPSTGSVNVGATLTLTAETENAEGVSIIWESDDETVATVNNGVVTGVAAGEATITATITVNGTNYSAESVVTVVDPNAPGTEDNPYTVAQAIAYINTLGSSLSPEEVYVSGIISQVDSYDSTHKSITYWISDDGTTSTQMEVYSGKGLNSADFSSVQDLHVGDIVTVCGYVKMYNSTPEFNYNNYLVSFQRPNAKQDAEISFVPESMTYILGDEWVTPSFSNPNELTVTFESNNTNIAKVSSDGTITLTGFTGTAVITATSAETNDYYAGSATFTLQVKSSDVAAALDDYVKVTSADELVEGGQYLIVYDMGMFAEVLGAITTNNYGTDIDIEKDDLNIIKITNEEVSILTLSKNGNNYAFQSSLNNEYLSWSSGNSLTTSEEVVDNSSWSVTVNEDGIATITNFADNSRKLQYNTSSPRFACYTSSQGSVSLYKKNTSSGQFELNIGSTGFATLYYGTSPLTIPEGVTAYAVHTKDVNGYTDVEFSNPISAGTNIPAGMGIILQGEAGSYSFPFYNGSNGVIDDENILMGSDEAKRFEEEGYEYFVLGKLNDVVGFYHMNPSGGKWVNNGAHKAFFCLPEGESILNDTTSPVAIRGGFSIEEMVATAIENVESKETIADGWFTLQGVRIERPTVKGIYINNGKKVLVK